MFDVFASHQMLWGWCALGIVIFIAAARRRKACRMVVFGLICVCIAMYPVVTYRIMMLPDVDVEGKAESTIRVITSNIHPVNVHWQEDLAMLFSMDADVVVLNEVSPELSRAIRLEGYLDSTDYSNWEHRYWVKNETSPGIIISRWPIRQIKNTDTIAFGQNHLYTRIIHPTGEIIVALAHPLSPRSRDRWAEGNHVIESQALRIRELIEQTNELMPMVIGADLNAGPAQVRARTMRRAGMRMSKPMIRTGGSFPANSQVPSWFRVQLDDVWTRGSIKPIAWSSFELVGSDHRAVMVDLVLK